jgi:hypothetical protein
MTEFSDYEELSRYEGEILNAEGAMRTDQVTAGFFVTSFTAEGGAHEAGGGEKDERRSRLSVANKLIRMCHISALLLKKSRRRRKSVQTSNR